jgi:Protein of unknown function (DUF4058)
MPSPFPGMNPYLEQSDLWQDFHTEFLTGLRHQLDPLIGPDYIVQFEKHVYIHELPPEPRRLLGRPDVSVVRTGAFAAGHPNLGLLEAPAEVQIPELDVERVAFLEVRDRRGRELVTVIELLSPSNKRPGDDRSQYLGKRREIFRSTAHLVEIDLLRGWPPMPAEDRPEGDYSVLVSRAGRRPRAEFWPIRLRNRLPVIPIPLKPTDPDSQVDLQEVPHQAYDGGGYRKFIYEGPPEPPLNAQDAEWAATFLPRPA